MSPNGALERRSIIYSVLVFFQLLDKDSIKANSILEFSHPRQKWSIPGLQVHIQQVQALLHAEDGQSERRGVGTCQLHQLSHFLRLYRRRLQHRPDQGTEIK